MRVAKPDFLRCVGADQILIENAERFAQIDLDLSDFEKECTHCNHMLLYLMYVCMCLSMQTDRPVSSSGFTSEPFRVVAERLMSYSGADLIRWTAEKYGRPLSYTLAELANRLEVNVDGKRTYKHFFTVDMSAAGFQHFLLTVGQNGLSMSA